jgi:tetratricopeptide (TPR) repeat protein
MLAAGEEELAIDELRWLLEDCSDFIAAHKLLGELAVAAGDLPLARGHFGYAYQIGAAALSAKGPGPLPYDLPANQPFLEAAKGLAFCLRQQGEVALARQVVEKMLACDPSDPLGVRAWLK